MVPVIVWHSAGSEFPLKNNSSFHAKDGLYGCPGCKVTLGGGHGRSARFKDCGPSVPNVDNEHWSKEAVEVGYVEVRPQALLMVTEKNRAYALGDML